MLQRACESHLHSGMGLRVLCQGICAPWREVSASLLIGEAGSGKSTTLERVLLPIFSETAPPAATQVTAFTLMKESASSNLIPLPLTSSSRQKWTASSWLPLYNHFRDSWVTGMRVSGASRPVRGDLRPFRSAHRCGRGVSGRAAIREEH